MLFNLIIVYAIVLALMLPFIFVKSYRITLKMRMNYSLYYIRVVLGWIIGINGDIRMGKTSLLSGLSSMCVMLIMSDIEALMDKTMRIFKKIDFNEFNKILTEVFNEVKYPDFEALTEEILESYQIDGDGMFFNMVGHIEYRKLILDYVFAFYVLNVRNNFVQSKTPFYSNVTHNFSMKLNLEWLKIREAYKNKDYAILDWMVILIDELTDEAGAMAYLDDIKDLAGAKEYRRKMGQIHQERNRIISTKQDVMDEVKKYRNLTHSNLVLEEKVSTVGNHMWIYHILEFIHGIPVWFLNTFVIKPKFIWSLIRRKGLTYYDVYKPYHDKVGLIRNNESKLYYYKIFFDSIGYNKYYGFKLKRAEDIERVSSEKDEFKLYIPTYYCFGTYNTHYYSYMQKELLENSNTATSEVNPFVKKSFFNGDQESSDQKEGDAFEFN